MDPHQLACLVWALSEPSAADVAEWRPWNDFCHPEEHRLMDCGTVGWWGDDPGAWASPAPGQQVQGAPATPRLMGVRAQAPPRATQRGLCQL